MQQQAPITDTVEPGQGVSDVVIRSVATLREQPPEELPQLYDRLDPDCLDGLFASVDGGPAHVTFRYCDAEVTVRSTGEHTASVSVDPTA